MIWFYVLSGLWAMVTLGVFIQAIRLSYAVERIVDGPNKWGLPTKTNVFASAFGARGRGDPQVDGLRRRLRALLAFIAAMFVFGWIAVSLLPQTPGAG